MGAELGRALLVLGAVLVPLGVAWAVVEGPQWWALRRGAARRDAPRRGGRNATLIADERHR